MTSKQRVKFELPDLELVVDTPFKEIHYSESENLLYQIWKPTTLAMDFEGFKEQALIFLDQVETHNPRFVISNHEDYQFSLTEEHNDWYSENLTSALSQSNLEKVAIIGNESLISQLQLENLIKDMEKETEDPEIITMIFDDFAKALNWIKK